MQDERKSPLSALIAPGISQPTEGRYWMAFRQNPVYRWKGTPPPSPWHLAAILPKERTHLLLISPIRRLLSAFLGASSAR